MTFTIIIHQPFSLSAADCDQFMPCDQGSLYVETENLTAASGLITDGYRLDVLPEKRRSPSFFFLFKSRLTESQLWQDLILFYCLFFLA